MPGDELAVGDLAYDTVTKTLGVVMDREPECYFLRPPGGGCEWEAPPQDVRPATASDRLSPALAERNAGSRLEAAASWE